jgi:hypothetical protein
MPITLISPQQIRDLERGWAPRAHACNPSYSGDRDQEDSSLKPDWANSLQDPISKNLITKIGLVKVKALRSSPSTTQKKKKRERELKRK